MDWSEFLASSVNLLVLAIPKVLDFVASIVKSLALPASIVVIVVFLAWRFEKEIKSLAGRVTNAKAAGVDIAFAESRERVENAQELADFEAKMRSLVQAAISVPVSGADPELGADPADNSAPGQPATAASPRTPSEVAVANLTAAAITQAAMANLEPSVLARAAVANLDPGAVAWAAVANQKAGALAQAAMKSIDTTAVAKAALAFVQESSRKRNESRRWSTEAESTERAPRNAVELVEDSWDELSSVIIQAYVQTSEYDLEPQPPVISGRKMVDALRYRGIIDDVDHDAIESLRSLRTEVTSGQPISFDGHNGALEYQELASQMAKLVGRKASKYIEARS